MDYLKHDLFKKSKILLAGSPITDLKKISQDPMLFSAKIDGERFCIDIEDITDVKPVIKKVKY